MDLLLRQVRKARWRLGFGRFLQALGWTCFAALTLALGCVTADKFWPMGIASWIWAAAAVASGVVAAAVWALIRDRGPLDAAIELDRRFELKERVSSALAISEEGRESNLGRALVDDAIRRVNRIDVSGGIRVRPGRQILLPLIPGLLVVLVTIFVSPAVDNAAQASSEGNQARKTNRPAVGLERKLAKHAEEAKEKGLEDAVFERLRRGAEELASMTQNERKQALVELNDLKRTIEQRRNDVAAAERMRDQFENLRDMERGPADKLLEEIRRGNFDKAKDQLDQLKAALAKGDLSPEDREKLAKQLDQMKKKLEDMAKAHGDAMKDLEQRAKQARAEGRNDEASKMEEMLDALRQQMPQMDQLGNMADKMGQCAQSLRDGGLQEASDLMQDLGGELEDLQAQMDELELLDEAMGDIAQCRNQANCPACGGAGCQACQGQPGMGMGEGQGMGPRPEAEDSVNFYDAKSPVEVQKGEATVVGNAGWSAVKGNVQEQIQEQFESAQRAEGDPLTGQRLPRRMRPAIQQYFDDFREAAD
jgi:hypothetical protein